LFNNVLYNSFEFGNVQKFPKEPLDVPINYLNLPPILGENVFLSTDLEEIKEKCPNLFNADHFLDKARLYTT